MEVERFWMQTRRASSKPRFSENLHFHLGFPSKGQRGPTPHQNPYVLWKKLTLCKVSGFYEETSRKTDKINKTSSGTKELYCKRGGLGWPAWPLHFVSLWKSASIILGSPQQSLHQGCCEASHQSRRARVHQKTQHSSKC